MHKDISPEEKLLSIIKGKQNNAPSAAGLKPEAVDVRVKKSDFGDKIDGYLLAVLKNNFFKNNLFDPESLKTFNKYMVIVLALITLYLFFDIILMSPSRRASSVISKIFVSGSVAPRAGKEMPIETKNYSHYSNKITGKSVFNANSYGQAESREEALSTGDAGGGNLGLVGIVPGDNPQAIIEEKKSQKTYYLIKGQAINDIVVEDINENKVILNYKGKRTTLFL